MQARLAASMSLFTICFFLVLPYPVLAASTGYLTELSGSGSLIRGTSRYPLTEGIKIEARDILELEEGTLGQVEFRDGTAVALGNKARVCFLAAAGQSVAVAVLEGAIKAYVPKDAGLLRIDSSLLRVAMKGATATMLVSPGQAQLFAEVGRLKLERPGKELKEGEYLAIKPGEKPMITTPPPQSFVSALPRPFLDQLPQLLAKLTKVDVPLGKPRPFTYEEVRPWLSSMPEVRRQLVAQWKSKAQDPAFRKGLLRDLKEHPEWRPVLFPPKNRLHGKSAEPLALLLLLTPSPSVKAARIQP